MNIRKFIGSTSRDALRLVREALGADAVVLSNRALDDGSVEIVALADSELAAIAPPESSASSATGGGAQPFARRSQGAAPNGANVANPSNAAPGGAMPYASGMSDVFSSVFGASPEVGAEPGFGPGAFRAADTTGTTNTNNRQDEEDDDDGISIALGSVPAPAESRVDSRAAAVPVPELTDLVKPAAPAPTRAPAAAAAPQTMAESNPWLIDHAHWIAHQQDNARAAGITPAAAIAKGLGMPADPVLPPGVDASTPEWAREAAEAAARRAAQRVGTAAPEAAGPTRTGDEAAARAQALNAAQTVGEAIRARIEQVVNETVMGELSSLRGMMEEQFAGLLWGERQRRNPVQGALTKQLFAAGFSAQLVKMMIERLPAVETEEAGLEWIQSVLESNLPVLEDEEALMQRGGVFALMGPTGVGKTTTTAKLAARCVMRFGASRVALLTTDSYRIGGHEQLRIFGRILGVSVHAVRDGADLQLALTELKNKHIVLIDTIGMSQRDRAVADQISMLCGAGRPVQRLLLLSATSHGDTLNEVVQAYRNAPDEAPLAGCILTKLDEATHLGSTLDTVLRYKLPVHYVSTGQKVPENLYVATRRFLIRSAFCIPRDHSPFVPHEDDIPALLSALSTQSGSQMPEVRFG